MGKITIYISQQVIDYLDNLVFVLYKEEYFGFIESAEEYVSKIYDSIPENIGVQGHKSTPLFLRNFGSKYLFYKANSKTTWYMFFEQSGHKVVVTGILNNHSPLANELK